MKNKTPAPAHHIEVFHVDKDGIAGRTRVPLTVEDDLCFSIEIPNYMVKALDLGDNKRFAPKALDLIPMYESIAERYQGWRLKRELQPMLAIPFSAHSSGARAGLQMSLLPVWATKDGKELWHRTGTTENVLDFGEIGDGCALTQYLLLPDNREVREKAQRLIDSLTTAGTIIKAVYGEGSFGPDMLSRFMNIGEQPAGPPPEVKVTMQVVEADPRQAELPLAEKKGADDDEEL